MDTWIGKIMFSISAMMIVFAVLTALMGMIKLMSVALKERVNKKPEPEKVEKSADETAVEYYEENDDCEVVAAIMAALSASLDVPTDKLVIKKIKRIDRGTNWRN